MDKIFSLFAAKKSLKPELKKVHIENKFAYATDSFKAIRLQLDTPKDIGTLKALEVLGKVKLTDENDNYPEIEHVIPKDAKLESSDYISVGLSPVFLAQVASALKLMDPKGLSTMTLYVPLETGKPVVFKNKIATVLLMPCHR